MKVLLGTMVKTNQSAHLSGVITSLRRGHRGAVGTTLFIKEIGRNTENSDISDFASFALKLTSDDWTSHK